jgi:hypothetical protein
LPDGSELKWKQIGVRELLTERELPFFIEWLDGNHPSKVGTASSSVSKILFANQNPLDKTSFENQINVALQTNSILVAVIESDDVGIAQIEFETRNGFVAIN